MFAADSASGHIEEPKFALAQVAAACGVHVGPHDLRRSFITVAESSELSVVALTMLVNHSVGNDVTSGYIILSTPRLREAAQTVADRLKELCGIVGPEGVSKLRTEQKKFDPRDHFPTIETAGADPLRHGRCFQQRTIQRESRCLLAWPPAGLWGSDS